MLAQVTRLQGKFFCQATRCVFEDAGILYSLIGRENVYPCETELQLDFTAFLWFLFCDGQECGKTGKKLSIKNAQKWGKSKIPSQFQNLVQLLKAARSHSGNTF